MNKPSTRQRIDAALADWIAQHSTKPDVVFLGLRDSMQLDMEMQSLVTYYSGMQVLFNGAPSSLIILGRKYG
jgi:hypothetical protein